MVATSHLLKLLFLSVCAVTSLVGSALANGIPKHWIEREAQGQLLLSESNVADLMPFVGNGWIATTIDSDSIFIQGVFNGPAGTKNPSHRARIPNWSRITLQDMTSRAALTPSAAALDLERGKFVRIWRSPTNGDNLFVTETLLAHRTRRNLLVHVLAVHNLSPQPWSVAWGENGGSLSHDIAFKSIPSPPWTVSCGWTLEAESSDAPLTQVCIASFNSNGNVTVAGNSNAVVVRLFSAATSLESKTPVVDAVQTLKTARATELKALVAEHEAEWRGLWKSGIEISGNAQLAQIVNSTLYYLMSSARADWPWSFSPGSLSSNSYNGHVFWDTETWMFPGMALLHRGIANALLEYRNQRLSGAALKARSNGYQGYQFPWESAQTGVEVTPTTADTGIYEQHISSDIVLAVELFYRITGDLKWLESFSDLVFGVADFWVSRTQLMPDGTTYGIYGVTGPDEYAINVNNSVYTNVAAQKVLLFATECAQLFNKTVSSAWTEVGSHMYIPFDEKMGIHPEFDGYKGQQIKQADVVLLGYPLGLQMPDEVKLNDVLYYAQRTDVDGPCMTDGIHTIALLELGRPDMAAEYFPKSYANAKAPYWVWQETPKGGAVNFITGAGGFLQAVMNGYGGIRVNTNHIAFRPTLPATSQGVTSMKLRQISFLSCRFDVQWSDSSVSVHTVSGCGGLFLIAGPDTTALADDQIYQVPTSESFSIGKI